MAAPVNPTTTPKQVCTYARLVVKQTMIRSRLARQRKHVRIPTYTRDELVLGDLLGSGSFNNVYQVKSIKEKDCDYAVKFLKKSALLNQDAAADLLLESTYLKWLASHAHENIITLHGTAAEGASGFSQEEGFFIILDRLQETLEDRMKQWHKLNASLDERLQVAVALSSALAHLHDLKIVFRDVKPQNIGFDKHDTLKLFDFGLCKELDPRTQCGNDAFVMSGGTGSRRYMAPEVASKRPYGTSADVYSFTVILQDMLQDLVELPTPWLQELLEAGRAHDAHVRPTMQEIHDVLSSHVSPDAMEVSSDEMCSEDTSSQDERE